MLLPRSCPFCRPVLDGQVWVDYRCTLDGIDVVGRAQLILAKDEKTDETVVIKKFNKKRDQDSQYIVDEVRLKVLYT